MSKIITINPELFKTKTKKISPKLINKTLINRINRIKEKKGKIYTPKENQAENKFDESNNFLSSILQKSPKKTIKVHKPLNNYTHSPIHKSVENLLFKPDNSEVVNINYKVDNEKPYGNLIGGLKPTLKKWKMGKKIRYPTHVNDVKYSEEEEEKRILESEINKKINGKTEFSTDLLAKFQNEYQNEEKLVISDEDVQIEPEIFGHSNLTPINLQPLPSLEQPLQPVLQPLSSLEPLQPVLQPPQLDLQLLPSIDLPVLPIQPVLQPLLPPVPVLKNFEPKIVIKPNLKEELEPEEICVNQKITRKYNIGKTGNKVGLLVSNKKTRKNISDHIKELQNTPINIMKNELKKGGLIQVGSSAPNEVIRKIYECSRLSGEVQNDNKEILMNNLLNDN